MRGSAADVSAMMEGKSNFDKRDSVRDRQQSAGRCLVKPPQAA
jgi:hypothetical protein